MKIRFEEISIMESIWMKIEGEKVNDAYIEYLTVRNKRNFSSEMLEQKGINWSEDRIAELKKNFTLIVLVDNYKSGQSEKVKLQY